MCAAAAAVAVAVACTAPAQQPAGTSGTTARPTATGTSARPAPKASPKPTPTPAPTLVAVGAAGTYEVGGRQLTFVAPAHTGPTGRSRGPFPLIVFAPGFVQCVSTYANLLKAWAGAGYVVAAVTFPRTNCGLGAAAYEPDLVNQPHDVAYVLTRMLALSARPGNPLSGLLNPGEVAVAGQSDGGDTVAALAANTCCTDHRPKAVAVLSGAEWPPMPGRYFPGGEPPMLFVQGSADTINPPWTSVQLYTADKARTRYYLDLFGATHMEPYAGTNPVERLVSRVTLAFFNRYVLGQAGAAAKMAHYGN